jgi:hypothetical protein
VGGRRLVGLVVAACVALSVASAAAGSRGAIQWRTWWGTASVEPAGVTLSSTPPASPDETHSALVTSRQTWTNPTISFTTTTVAQLRTGSAPNPWEVGWVMFRFRDLSDYYYFILKTNGYELGKKQGSDAQVFLATGDLPALAVGTSRRIQVQVSGPRIRVYVDGAKVVDYVDPSPLTGAGSVGLYEEDSRVAFTSVATSGT